MMVPFCGQIERRLEIEIATARDSQIAQRVVRRVARNRADRGMDGKDMKRGSRRVVVGLGGTAVIFLLNCPLSALPANGQAGPSGQAAGAQPPMAEEVFK